MVGTRASNRRANLNGARGERIVNRRHIGRVDGIARKQAPTVAERIDGYRTTKKHEKLEVKTCDASTRDGSGTRAGRPWFSRKQHDALVRRGGYYAIVVEKPRARATTLLVKARDVPAPKSKARAFTVSYKALKEARVVRGGFRPHSSSWWERVTKLLPRL